MGMKKGLDLMPASQRRQIFNGWKAPYELTSVQAGNVESVHEVTARALLQAAPRARRRPDRRSGVRLALHLPVQRQLGDESDPGDVPGLGYFFNMYRGKPLVREGGVLIMSHPTPWEFHPVHHPSYIDFFEQLLAETTDPIELEQKYEKQFAEDEWYIHLYRNSYAYHGVHPFYMWYWGSHALEWLGKVIVVGGDPRAVRRLGFQPASTMQDASRWHPTPSGRRPRSPICTTCRS